MHRKGWGGELEEEEREGKEREGEKRKERAKGDMKSA